MPIDIESYNTIGPLCFEQIDCVSSSYELHTIGNQVAPGWFKQSTWLCSVQLCSCELRWKASANKARVMQSLISRLNPERKQNINRAILMHPSLRLLLLWWVPPPQIDRDHLLNTFWGLVKLMMDIFLHSQIYVQWCKSQGISHTMSSEFYI